MVDKILQNVILAPMTTLGIGGPARYFLEATTVDDILRGFEFAAAKGVDVFILGGGSNLLIADTGIDGLVIKVSIGGLEFTEQPDGSVIVIAGAGEDWDKVVAECVARGLAGLECLSGIPGFVGGTPVQNVGAYGQEVSETIISVDCLDRITGRMVKLENNDCGFSYRKSIFNSDLRDRYVVLNVVYKLFPHKGPKIVYKDLIDRFSGRQPTLADVREAVLAIRRSKAMVIDPSDPDSRSAGSFFKNPVVSRLAFEELRTSFGQMPSFAFDGGLKIPAAWLIENAGIGKGFVMGNAGVSSKHTLALINRGNATAGEMIALKKFIQDKVEAKFGIGLVQEPVLAGFSG